MVYIVVYIDFCYPFFCQSKLFIKKRKTMLFVDIYVKTKKQQTNKHKAQSLVCRPLLIVKVTFPSSSSLKGKYMYIETSSPRRPGDKAKLVFTIPNNGEMSCLSFYYHMYGASVGTLNVYNGNSKVFNISGQQSNYWIMVERSIILNGLVREKLGQLARSSS